MSRIAIRLQRAARIAPLLLLCAAAPSGCIDNDPMRVQSFTPGPAGNFTYSVRTNTVLSANDDGGAEQIRRQWLAQTLVAHGMCSGGYVVYQRQLVVPPQKSALAALPFTPANPYSAVDFGNTGYVVYSGACL
jgi:hypothetical protein